MESASVSSSPPTARAVTELPPDSSDFFRFAVLVRNLPLNVTETEIYSFFSPRCGPIDKLKLSPLLGQVHTVDAVIMFVDERGAREACRLGTFFAFGTEVIVEPLHLGLTDALDELTVDDPQFGRDASKASSPFEEILKLRFSYGEDESEKDPSMSHGFIVRGDEQLLSATLFVTGMPPDTPPAYLRHIFKVAGRVTKVRVCQDKDNKSFGFVEFATDKEAIEGLKLHGMLLGGFVLSVQHARRPISTVRTLPHDPKIIHQLIRTVRIANIYPTYHFADVQATLESECGQIVAYDITARPDAPWACRVEFADPRAAADAIAKFTAIPCGPRAMPLLVESARRVIEFGMPPLPRHSLVSRGLFRKL